MWLWRHVCYNWCLDFFSYASVLLLCFFNYRDLALKKVNSNLFGILQYSSYCFWTSERTASDMNPECWRPAVNFRSMKVFFFSPPISMRSAFLCYSRASLEMCLGLVFFYFWTALQRGFVGLTTLCFYVVYPSEATGICFSRDLLSHQHLLWLHKNWLLYTNPWMHRKENKLSP